MLERAWKAYTEWLNPADYGRGQENRGKSRWVAVLDEAAWAVNAVLDAAGMVAFVLAVVHLAR